MANVIIDNSNLTNIANAIREKNKSSDTYKPNEMAEAIKNIQSYKPEETFTATPKVTSQTITPREGYVFSSGTVNSLYSDTTTESEMATILLSDANIGKMYRYIGTTGSTYTNGRLYLCEEDTSTYPLCFMAASANSTITMNVTGTPTLNQNFQYSTDRTTWETFTPGTTTITLTNIGDIVYFKGNNPNGVSESSSIFYEFSMTGRIGASGNIMSLIDENLSTDTIPNAYCFYRLFKECNVLVTAPKLPATNITNNCYQYMFQGCKALITPPELPATTLAPYCYDNMFSWCEALGETPILPASELPANCYSYMFQFCIALTKSYSLTLTSLGSGCCEGMFRHCTSLAVIPNLNVTNLGPYCYQYMFSECSALKISETQTEECSYAYRIPTTGIGIEAANSIYGMFNNTGGTFTGTPTINTTYYTQKQAI